MTAPRATYRLQLAGDFGFAAARALVPYLRDLGVSHVYLPPSFQARAGSTHGYDVVDPNAISSERGGEGEFFLLVEAVKAAGLGIVLDIVPNHMAANEQENRFWGDPKLRPTFFDFDPVWSLPKPYQPIHALPGIERATQDRFFLVVDDAASPETAPAIEGVIKECEPCRVVSWQP